MDEDIMFDVATAAAFRKPQEITKEFGSALAKAQADMGAAILDARNPAFKSGYATISSILECVKPPLNNHGIALTMPAVSRPDGFVGAFLEIRFENEVLVVPPFWIKPAVMSPHGLVGALTYSRRAALASYFAIPQEDDDGNEATGHGHQQPQPQTSPRQQQPRPSPRPEATDEVHAAAAAEAEQRIKDKAFAAQKAVEDKALFKEEYAKFKEIATSMGFTGDMKALAIAMTGKNPPNGHDLAQLIVRGDSAAWNKAIDDMMGAPEV